MITKKLQSVTAALPMVTDGNKAACLRKPVDTKERLDAEAVLSVVLTVLMLAAMVPSAMAATLEEINQDEVFLKQQQRGTCTLASTAMMLRRAAHAPRR